MTAFMMNVCQRCASTGLLLLRNINVSWNAVTVCKRNIFYRKKYEFDRGKVFNVLYGEHDFFSREGFNRFFKKRDEEELMKVQKFHPDMFEFYGPDLWVARFVTWSGGKIKPKDDVVWLSKGGRLTKDLIVEGIDTSTMVLFPVGLDNIGYLKELRYMKYGTYITDWYLFHLQAFRHSLEFVDISGCENITDAGIASLTCLRNLKCLDITGCTKIKNPEVLAIHLESLIPELVILGLDTLPKFEEDQFKDTLESSRFLCLGEHLESESEKKLPGKNTSREESDISESSYSSETIHKSVTS